MKLWPDDLALNRALSTWLPLAYFRLFFVLLSFPSPRKCSLHDHGLLNFHLIQRLIEESVAMRNILKNSNIHVIFIGKETRYDNSLVGTVGWLWIPSKFEKVFAVCLFYYWQIIGKWNYLLIDINYNYVSPLFDQEKATICIIFYHTFNHTTLILVVNHTSVILALILNWKT